MRKQYTPAFKAQLVQEMLREQKSVAQLAAEHGVHPTMLYLWRDQALQAMPTAFSNNAAKEMAVREQAYQDQIDQLYREVGKLTTQLNWLKKKAGHLADDLPT